LGNIGLPSFRAAALTSVFLFREFIFDGGYYPKGGMQKFPDVLLERFREYGGTALLLSPAEEIILDSAGAVKAIRIKCSGKNSVEIKTKIIIANCDPYQIYNKLLRRAPNTLDQKRVLDEREPTVSAFMVHLGVNHDISLEARYRCNIWSYKRGHIDEYYEGVKNGQIDFGVDTFLFCSIPSFHDPELLPKNHHSIQAIVAAPYYGRDVWNGYKEKLAEDVVKRLDQFIPGIRKWVKVEMVATPQTLVKYTWNHLGAMYGWASTPDQVGRKKIPEKTMIDGLYMVGHWTGLPSGHSGIPTVVTSGRNVARLVLRKFHKDKRLAPLDTSGSD
jgi:prolycopene isomerase